MELASALIVMDLVCCVVKERTEKGLFCLLSLSLAVWMSALLRHFSRTTEKGGWNTRTASGQDFPQPPSLISFTALSSDSSHKQINVEKTRGWRRKGRGESEDKRTVGKRCLISTDIGFIIDMITSSIVYTDLEMRMSFFFFFFTRLTQENFTSATLTHSYNSYF